MATMSENRSDGAPEDAARLIDAKVAELDDWRGEMLARLRARIHEADPDVIEEVKWRGVPVWSHAGIISTGETYRNVVKMTFPKGAFLPDLPASSTQALKAIPGAPSISVKATGSTKQP